MCSWLIAGLQGLINATIVLDLVVHNTLWIVGHFHNMALLNIGLVIFAAMYAFMPGPDRPAVVLASGSPAGTSCSRPSAATGRSSRG